MKRINILTYDDIKILHKGEEQPRQIMEHTKSELLEMKDVIELVLNKVFCV